MTKAQIKKLEERIMMLERKLQAVLSLLVEDEVGSDFGEGNFMPDFEEIQAELGRLN